MVLLNGLCAVSGLSIIAPTAGMQQAGQQQQATQHLYPAPAMTGQTDQAVYMTGEANV